jgi:tRNA pseudouridine55 synthase
MTRCVENTSGNSGDKAPAAASPKTVNGVLVLDKPEGITSFAAVDRVKRILKVKKAGHCGTLDPIASGVLVVCLNQATRVAELLIGQRKRYRFTLRLGAETDTLDRAGEVVQEYEGPPVDFGQVEAALEPFRGSFEQQVPRYAAVKVDGRRLYKWTREGVEMERPSRGVEIRELELLDYRWPEARLEVLCSKGTYIRQLASDIGARLGCGAYVSELQRLASGSFTLEQAVTLDELYRLRSTGEWTDRVLDINRALGHLPSILVSDPGFLQKLGDGHLDPDWEVAHRPLYAGTMEPVRLLDPDGRLLALWWPEPPSGGRKLRLFR